MNEAMVVTVTLALVSLACVAGLIAVVWKMGATIVRLSDTVSCHSDHQLERIRYETGADATKTYAAAIARNRPVYVPQPEQDVDAFVPNRNGVM